MPKPKNTKSENVTSEYIGYLKQKPLLLKSEYKILTGVSVPTITRLFLAGKIPGRKIGGRVLLTNDLCNN